MAFLCICLSPEMPLATFEWMASGSISGEATGFEKSLFPCHSGI